MSKQDANGVRSAKDLENKYNFAELLGIKKNFEVFQDRLTKINNELNNTINALLINLKDVLDTQKEVSLYFSEGTPNLENFPYTTWTQPEEHIGDLYYNQTTGYVYQFNGVWNINEDVNLVQAMALTNIEIDTTEDKERKIFFQIPSPPYSSGDWWIKKDGTLYICQLGKSEGDYEEKDFIISSKYTATIAVKENNTIKVIKGTLQEITEDYVKYTDLSTGGSTTIAGENITTGSIKSANYVANTSGMKIDLEDGTIHSKNSKLDENGNWVLQNGATVISDKGLKNTYLSNQKGYLGFYPDFGTQNYKKDFLDFEVILPSNITITKATVCLTHFPVKLGKIKSGGTVDNPVVDYDFYWGRSTKAKLYKANGLQNRLIVGYWQSEGFESDSTTYTEISNAFGSNGWTANIPSDNSHQSQQVESIDIKNHLNPGLNIIRIQSDDTVPTSDAECIQKTGYVNAILKVEGYANYDV